MSNPSLALTMGEPAGIGGELTLKAWKSRCNQGPAFITIDNADRLSKEMERLGIYAPLETTTDPRDTEKIFPHALPVFDIPLDRLPKPGEPITETAPAILMSIKTAVEWALEGLVSAVVTNSIHKNTLYKSGFQHPGHTEYLAELSGPSSTPVMMLTCPGLRTVPVTVHIGLRQGLDALTSDLIVAQALITDSALRNDFAITSPRLAIAGLNPHAGEAGSMGCEEATIISPAIKVLQNKGINVTGPEPPDTLFAENKRNTYDAAICMYHDQALIPIKTLDFAGGVNITLGLPIIRTSPDHGTGLDITQNATANPCSLIAALATAAALATRRASRK